MKRLLLFGLLLLVGAEVFGQGSAPSPPQLWRRKGTADTSFIVIKTGDTVMVYDTANYTKIQIRGGNVGWLLPDSMIGTTVRLTDRIIAANMQVGQDGGSGSLIFDNFASATTFYSLLGNGLENSGGYLTVTIGASVEGSEITNQTIKKADIDTTIAMVYAGIYLGTSAVADSAVVSRGYTDTHVAGYDVVGSPSNGQVLTYNGGLGDITWTSGGGGSGDDARIDQTLSNSDYIVGSTTYPGGFWDVSTFTLRGDTGINFVKSGQHPGDTVLGQIDFARVQRNDGSRDIRVFRDSVGDDTLLIIQDSGTVSKMTTSNSGGWKFNSPINIQGNLRFWGLGKRIDSVSGIRGYSNYLYIESDAGLYLNANAGGGGADVPLYIGSSTNHTFDSDTLKGLGAQSKITDYGRIKVDTVRTGQIRMQSNSLKFLSDTTNPTQDVALTMTRDTANDTTKMTVSGKFQIAADAGFTEMDSVTLHGRLRMYDGTNKSRIDSASQVLADTLKTLPGGFLALQGATSGRTRFKGNASAITSYDLVLPAAQGSANQALINDGSGNLSWGSAGTGNGSADFDTVGNMDSGVVKGAGGTELFGYKKTATPNIVIDKGSTMGALILGGNNSGLSAADTSFVIYKSLYLGNAAGVNSRGRLDSTFIANELVLNRRYITPDDIYWHASRALTFGITGTWGWVDSSGVTDTALADWLFTLADSSGSDASYYPIHIRVNTAERDSLYSLVFKYKTGAGTDTTTNGITKAVLAVNGARVDSVTGRNLFSSSLTTDSMNFTDRALAMGDKVVILLYCRTNPAAARRTITLEEAYLNMRRY